MKRRCDGANVPLIAVVGREARTRAWEGLLGVVLDGIHDLTGAVGPHCGVLGQRARRERLGLSALFYSSRPF